VPSLKRQVQQERTERAKRERDLELEMENVKIRAQASFVRKGGAGRHEAIRVHQHLPLAQQHGGIALAERWREPPGGGGSPAIQRPQAAMKAASTQWASPWRSAPATDRPVGPAASWFQRSRLTKS
jgi:hypothetical protein